MDPSQRRWRDSGRDWGNRANSAAHQMAQRVDDTTGVASDRLAPLLVVAVRILRVPTAVVWLLPVPAIATVLILGIAGGGPFGTILIVLAVLMAVVSGAFFGRRRRILQAVDDPQSLAGELRQLFNLTGRLDDGAQVIGELTSSGSDVRTFGRLRTAWRGVALPAHWVDQVNQLKRARYFAPPKVGTTITLTLAALWLVPISLVVALLTIVASIAGSL